MDLQRIEEDKEYNEAKSYLETIGVLNYSRFVREEGVSLFKLLLVKENLETIERTGDDLLRLTIDLYRELKN